MKKIMFMVITAFVLVSCNNTAPLSLETSCQQNGGTWIEEAKECEYISADWCEAEGGFFNECGSACRNDPNAEVCTMQCVPVCNFWKIEETNNQTQKQEDVAWNIFNGESVYNIEETPFEGEWEKLSIDQAKELIVSKNGMCDINECESLEIDVFYSQQGNWYIEALYDGLRDDSIKAIKRVYEVQYVDSQWELSSEIVKEYQCHEWRGHRDFSQDFCN